MSDQPVYRVGIIGGGRQGTIHARAYHVHPRTEVAAVADSDEENLELFCRRFDVPGYSTFDEMFAKEELDISAPVLPVKANADAVVASARAGVKAVFCEKPLAGMLSDADRMVEECRSRGVLLAAGLVVSSHPDYRKAYELAASGEIGDVVRINLYNTNKQVGTHGLNLARKFANKSDVDFVTGFVENDPFAEHEDDFGDGEPWYGEFGGHIRFKNGIDCFSGYGSLSWRGMDVHGTDGLITNYNNTGLGLRLWKSAPGPDPTKMTDLVEVEGVFKPQRVGERGYDAEGWRDTGEVMRESINHIVECLDEGKQLEITTGDDLRHALEISIALRESARQDGARVALPIEDRSIVMHPQRNRWNYKKDVFGADWYREAMTIHVRES